MTTLTNQLADKIIQEQALIIGPIAWEQAGKVTGLRIDIIKHEVSIEGDTRDVLERLVAQYEKLFGKASREVCRDAVRPLLSQVPEGEIPAVLK
ncbi:MAG: hypothetical protein O3A36_03460 [bacterium]|nr:hypothetical protein [bacterium]